jgi:hypothetical protein
VSRLSTEQLARLPELSEATGLHADDGRLIQRERRRPGVVFDSTGVGAQGVQVTTAIPLIHS